MSKLPDINVNFCEWYNEVIYQAELADQSPVRGCMVIRPYGCQLWENIKVILDKKIKETGHHNAIFPLLIPLSFLQKEAKHVEGFAPEVAVVTHAGGKELEEPYVIRPTSETIIHAMFSRWIKSWRDLPLKINQWANVVRWEKRTRPFLRTTEFFWQEGHTAHETEEEALAEALLMLNVYVDLVEHYLAIPVFARPKPASERFAGADETFTIEGIMPDGKALQMGTSHLISQNFAKSFEITFQNKEGSLSYPYLTSWGATTRLIGALVMMHGDTKGLIIPPRIAPIQVVIVPIFRKDANSNQLKETAQTLAQMLRHHDLSVVVDDQEHETPGAKFYAWELKGVPVRLELGPRDLANQQVVAVPRLGMGKKMIAFHELAQEVSILLDTVQAELFKRAQARCNALIKRGDKLATFGTEFEGYAVQTGWCRKPACEVVLKEYKATIRCLLEENNLVECFNCSAPSISDVLIARSY
jgi:prolyl-tRNA synthetase